MLFLNYKDAKLKELLSHSDFCFWLSLQVLFLLDSYWCLFLTLVEIAILALYGGLATTYGRTLDASRAINYLRLNNAS